MYNHCCYIVTLGNDLSSPIPAVYLDRCSECMSRMAIAPGCRRPERLLTAVLCYGRIACSRMPKDVRLEHRHRVEVPKGIVV